MTEKEIIQVIKEFRKKKNVLGGSSVLQPKIKNGKIIEGSKVIRIYVSRKEMKCMLSSKDIVPSTVKINNREYETDIVEIGDIRALEGNYPDPKLKYRPLVPGISTMNANSNGACSLGFFARDLTSDQIVQLSNNHCFGLENKAHYGDPVIQPSILDGGNKNTDYTGKFIRSVELKFTSFTCPYRNSLHSIYRSLFGVDTNKVDVSCASITIPEGYSLKTLNGIEITGCKDPDIVARPWSYGRSSGYSYDGIYTDLNGVVQVQYSRGYCMFEDVIIGLQNDTFKCIPGDSGSPLFEDDKIVGLRFAGSNVSWIACKWKNIEELLQVSFP